MSKSYEALVDIAKQMNVEYAKNATEEEISYAILDEQAFQEGNKNPLGRHRNRVKAAKNGGDKNVAEPDKVVNEAVNGQMPETVNADDADDAADTPMWNSPEEELAAIPKHRGRRTRREMELIALIRENKRRASETHTNDNMQDEEPKKQPSLESIVTDVEVVNDTIHKKQNDAYSPDVWEGDPGDGTDFIPLVDVPIEDTQVSPVYDIFDNPYYKPQEPAAAQHNQGEHNEEETKGEYDFNDLIDCNGVAEILNEGYGFLRSSDYNYLSSPDDVYVAQNLVKKYGLKTGDVVFGKVRPPKENEQYFTLTTTTMINGRVPNEIRDRIAFEHLTPLFPNEKFCLCGDPRTTNLSTRIVDLFSPIGKGQRALIVAQPKTGKTILMKDIANAIAANHPEAYLMMLLIDERPEEVTDMARTVNAEVIASTFDEPADRHVKIAGIVLEKAKRLVECGHDVVIFLDSITRLARAYNTVAPASGKVLTGGVDANALQKPKRFFGAARNIEGGGSLTIIATALIDTGSKMDEVIFEEFKGTGNMELQLDRTLSNKRIFPSVNLVASSTRRDDLLQDETTLNRMWILRNHISDMTAMEAMNTIRRSIERTRDNEEFLLSMNS